MDSVQWESVVPKPKDVKHMGSLFLVPFKNKNRLSSSYKTDFPCLWIYAVLQCTYMYTNRGILWCRARDDDKHHHSIRMKSRSGSVYKPPAQRPFFFHLSTAFGQKFAKKKFKDYRNEFAILTGKTCVLQTMVVCRPDIKMYCLMLDFASAIPNTEVVRECGTRGFTREAKHEGVNSDPFQTDADKESVEIVMMIVSTVNSGCSDGKSI
jgi:hypothetical protein